MGWVEEGSGVLGDMTGGAFEGLGRGWRGRLWSLRWWIGGCGRRGSWLGGLGSEFKEFCQLLVVLL